jgi:chemotaxis protein histidine kinase CheA
MAAAAAAASGWDGVDRRGAPAETKSAAEDSIRVDAVKLDALLEVAGESVQAANQASVLLEKLQQFKFDGPAEILMSTLAETLGRASRYATELQRATLATRMQPVGRLFQKFPRMVRELARELGKDVELVIEGPDTEVDRVVVDSLYDPLVDMLRNSLNHGIDTSGDRARTGKAPKARIRLKAWQEANSVMIVITDDGRGMDPVKLREKAASKGLIDGNASLSRPTRISWCSSRASRPKRWHRACLAAASAWTWSRLRWKSIVVRSASTPTWASVPSSRSGCRLSCRLCRQCWSALPVLRSACRWRWSTGRLSCRRSSCM